MWTIFFMRVLLWARSVADPKRPEGYDDSGNSPTARRRTRQVAGRLRSVTFPGPAGSLEGLWKEASGGVPRRGTAVFGHPHPLHGGTLHNKVVYRAALALSRAGYDTLRFNFRGVGLSEGRYDAGVGEIEDYRAALDEAERTGGLPIVAGGFSFGSAVGLKAAARDRRLEAYIALGLPLATESGRMVPKPEMRALFVVGEHDTFGPPGELERFVAGAYPVVVIPGADHFFEGQLEVLAEAIAGFLATLRIAPVAPAASAAEAP
jgi:alpha/beta superfamily hydrolase